MPTFSKKSLEKLATCDRRLYDICSEAIKHYDFVIICGHRNEEEQNRAFTAGKSKLKWPNSKHNSLPSLAIDLAPYPINWDNIESFKILGQVMLQSAAKLNIPLEWGGNWEHFPDFVHFQLGV